MDAAPALLLADPGWLQLGLVSLLAGLLCLDETAVAQTWVSQPLPAGVLTGLLVGDPVLGLAVGLPLQLVMIGNLPVGQSFTGDSTTAVVAVVGAAGAAGVSLAPALEGQTPAAQGLLGWLLLAAGLLSLAGHRIIQAERSAHDVWMLQGRLTLRDGSLRRMEFMHLRCLGLTFLRGFAACLLFTVVLTSWWLPAFSSLDPRLRTGLSLLPLLLPGIGIGTMVERFGWRRNWSWVAGGALAAFLLARVGGWA